MLIVQCSYHVTVYIVIERVDQKKPRVWAAFSERLCEPIPPGDGNDANLQVMGDRGDIQLPNRQVGLGGDE